MARAQEEQPDPYGPGEGEGENEAEVVQLSIFEGKPVVRRKLALGNAGNLPIGEDLHTGDEIRVTLTARVTKVVGHDPKGEGRLTRGHVAVVINADEAEIEVL